MNGVFFGIVAAAFGAAIWFGTPGEVGKAALDSAKSSVELAIGLVGYIALFLGLMKVVEEAGGLKFMARIIRPLLVRLFPDVPADHPAVDLLPTADLPAADLLAFSNRRSAQGGLQQTRAASRQPLTC